MKQINITSPIVGAVHIPNDLALYMYSPFPILVDCDTPTARLTLRISCAATRLSHDEVRSSYKNSFEFEASRIVQLVVPDVDDVFRMNLSQDGEASPYAMVNISLVTESELVAWSIELPALYGAADQTENRFDALVPTESRTRKLFVNYPQTLQIWRDISDEMLITGEFIDGDFYPALSLLPNANAMVEMDLMLHLKESQGQALDDALRLGVPAFISVSCRFGGYDNYFREVYYYWVRLIPDLTPRGEGTFLRWLHRDGTFGYWLFKNGSIRTNASGRNAFTRHVSGNPAEPVSGSYRNGAKLDFSEARQITLGTYCDTLDEYEYLCGLAESPVVERLITVSGEDAWQRINVVPGSYTRSQRFNTRSRQAFELTYELPERNTIRL